HPHDFTNFSWRLDEMGSTTAYADIELRFYGDNYISYILGGHPGYSPTNTSNYKYVYVDDYNVLDTWLHMVVNITADYEEIYGPSPDLIINRIVIDSYAVAGDRVSVLVDEMHFADGGDPVIDSVDFLPADPMYYESVDLTIYAHDDRSGIRHLYVDYYYEGSWFGVQVSDMGGYFEITFAPQAYGTEVQFRVSVTDNGGRNVIDDNGGLLYSYTVGDDVDPTLTITNPVNNTDVEGLLAITADADDLGSGVEYISFNPDGGGAISDYTAPYSQNWNLDDESLGSHFIIVSVRDLAGNTVTKAHYITVVDTTSPVLDNPDDVEFTVGETGYIIDWDPTDARPASYDVLVEGVGTFSGLWNTSSEHIVVELDGLPVGTYNYTCVVYDDAGHVAADTVNVTVNELPTTTTTTTTPSVTTTTTETTTTSETTVTTDTTTTTETTSEPTTSSTPTTATTPPPSGDMTLLLIAGAVGAVLVVIIIIVVLRKKS
ncbi:MAG: Ig-like domain-containing protein, partial [Candidatus Thorarchaeota archaeon]